MNNRLKPKTIWDIPRVKRPRAPRLKTWTTKFPKTRFTLTF